METTSIKAYSKDLRLKVLDAGDRGMPRVMGEALWVVNLEDVAGWFSHCSYEPRNQHP